MFLTFKKLRLPTFMSKTYLFYDIETTGLNKCFDQVLQFAAIRTDMQLNELNRVEIQVRLNPDVIPSPYAVLTHRIGPSEFQQGLNEVDALSKIHALLNEPNTISVGYNTLGFDDEFLRFSFYKNLLAPYTHQFANGCGRMDLYPITLLYHLFKPDCIQWPVKDDGQVSLKLDDINKANHFAKGQAHNAMVDVEATLALAKALAADSVMWNFAIQYFDKATDESRFNQTDTHVFVENNLHKTGLMVFGKLGAANRFVAPVIHCGNHFHYKNQSVWLRLDTPDIFEDAFPIKKKLAEPPLFLPLKSRYLSLLSEERVNNMEANLHKIAKEGERFTTMSHAHRSFKYPDVANVDVDAALYAQPFSTPSEEKLFQAFHRANPKDKMQWVYKLTGARQQQALRIMGRHYFDMLESAHQDNFLAYCEKELVDYRNQKKLTRAQALEEITMLLSSCESTADRALLVSLRDYLAGTKVCL
jgi:exodeoxyribonuclease-1